jgi:hypothetical protein
VPPRALNDRLSRCAGSVALIVGVGEIDECVVLRMGVGIVGRWEAVLLDAEQVECSTAVFQLVARARIPNLSITLKGARYRLRGRGIDSLPSIRTQDPAD